MNVFYRVLIIILFLQASSCFIFNNTKHFSVYKEPILQSTHNLPLKTDGIYISTNGRSSFFIYKNGKVKMLHPGFGPLRKEYWQTPQQVIKKMQDEWPYNSKERWGDYKIQNKQIIIQHFNHNNQYIFKRWIFEQKGNILNDSTIEIYSDYSTWTNEFFLDTICILNFYPTQVKPDSTKAWFEKRKWYKKGLHESRK